MFQVRYRTIVPTGHVPIRRYFKIEFVFNRAKYTAQPRPVDPEKRKLQAKAIELRSSGWSLPAIAKYLKISVGSVWNMTHANTSEHRDKLDSIE